MKKIIISMICIITMAIFGASILGSSLAMNREPRYITTGKVYNAGCFNYIDIDYLNETRPDDCLQVYYDTEDGTVHWVYAEWAMV